MDGLTWIVNTYVTLTYYLIPYITFRLHDTCKFTIHIDDRVISDNISYIILDAPAIFHGRHRTKCSNQRRMKRDWGVLLSSLKGFWLITNINTDYTFRMTTAVTYTLLNPHTTISMHVLIAQEFKVNISTITKSSRCHIRLIVYRTLLVLLYRCNALSSRLFTLVEFFRPRESQK